MKSKFILVLSILMFCLPLTAIADPLVDSSELRAAVTLDGVRDHQAALQDIADANAGNRAENTAGFSASSDYVRNQLIAAGFGMLPLAWGM